MSKQNEQRIRNSRFVTSDPAGILNFEATRAQLYTASQIFCERGFDIEVFVRGFNSEESAKVFANSCGNLNILSSEEQIFLVLQCPNGIYVSIPEDDFVFRVDTKIDQRPRPLDPSNKEDFALIMDSINNPDSPYILKDEDMQIIELPLSEIWKDKPIPYSFGHSIAYGILPE